MENKTKIQSLPAATKNISDIGKLYDEEHNGLILTPEKIYSSKLVTYKGSLKDCKITISDYVATLLLRDMEKFQKIAPCKTYRSYIVEDHQKQKYFDEVTNREEERFAKALFHVHKNKKEFLEGTDLGHIKDFQSPIVRNKTKKEAKSGTGKIDLISVSSKNKKNYLLELKYLDNTENLLRAVCEIFTYSKQIDHTQLRDELGNQYPVVPAVLVFSDCLQHLQYDCEQYYGKVKELMNKLGIEMFVISYDREIQNESMLEFAQRCEIKLCK